MTTSWLDWRKERKSARSCMFCAHVVIQRAEITSIGVCTVRTGRFERQTNCWEGYNYLCCAQRSHVGARHSTLRCITYRERVPSRMSFNPSPPSPLTCTLTPEMLSISPRKAPIWFLCKIPGDEGHLYSVGTKTNNSSVVKHFTAKVLQK